MRRPPGIIGCSGR